MTEVFGTRIMRRQACVEAAREMDSRNKVMALAFAPGMSFSVPSGEESVWVLRLMFITPGAGGYRCC